VVRRRWLVVCIEEMIGIVTKSCRCQISNDVHTYIPEDSDFGESLGGYSLGASGVLMLKF